MGVGGWGWSEVEWGVVGVEWSGGGWWSGVGCGGGVEWGGVGWWSGVGVGGGKFLFKTHCQFQKTNRLGFLAPYDDVRAKR